MVETDELEGEEFDDDLPPFWESLGLSPPVYQDESQAPPVDRALMWRLVCNELTDEEARSVHVLMLTFRSWTEAFSDAATEKYLRGAGHIPPPQV